MYRVQEEITVNVCTVYSVQGDMTGQYRYVQSTRRNNSKGMYSVQCTRRYDRTVQVCTVYSAQCREYKEILQDSTDIYNVQCTEL